MAKRKQQVAKTRTKSCLQCLACGWIGVSWYRHHFHPCYCADMGAIDKTERPYVAIDGGDDYTKVCGDPKQYLLFSIEIPLLKKGKKNVKA